MANFDDWEMLQSDLEDHEEEIGQGYVVADGAEGLMMLRYDYFSIDSGTGGASEDSTEGRSVESDNPSWIDPAESGGDEFRRRDFGELWPDSGSDRSIMSDCGGRTGLRFVQSGDDQVFEGEIQNGFLGKLGLESGGDSSVGVEFEGVHEVEKLSVVSGDFVEKIDNADFTSEEVTSKTEMEVAAGADGEIGKEVERPSDVDNKAVIWWKVPLDLVRFCVFRVNPLWSISVAAAMVGVFIMRRRLQNMKRKTKSLQMKVTVDHKKVNQFMSRAARLNEAFSVVKRAHIIRPSLPAPGVTPWHVVSMH